MTAASRYDNSDAWVSGGHEKFETPVVPIRDGEHRAAWRCELGHTQKAMECPACAGASDTEWWRWYRSSTARWTRSCR